MPSRRSLPPVACWRGVSPSEAAKPRPLLNRLASPTVATTAVAITGPTSGALVNRGSDLADGSDDEGKAAFLRGEDVLDARAHSGSRRIAASDVRRHRLASGLGPLKFWDQAVLLEQGEVVGRAIGGVGPDRAGGVGVIEHRAKLGAVMGRGVGHAEAAHEAVLAVDADVVLVPKIGTAIS